jgi:tetratricopeptide (TPR) repeat protein
MKKIVILKKQSKSRFISIATFAILIGGGCIITGGCGKDVKVKANPYHIHGLNLRQNNKFTEAATAFAKCLRIDPDFGEAHLQLGMLFEDHLNSPIQALYHYQMASINTDGQNAKLAESGLRRLIKQITIDNMDKYPEAINRLTDTDELQRQFKQMQTENERLRSIIHNQTKIIKLLKQRTMDARKQ